MIDDGSTLTDINLKRPCMQVVDTPAIDWWCLESFLYWAKIDESMGYYNLCFSKYNFYWDNTIQGLWAWFNCNQSRTMNESGGHIYGCRWNKLKILLKNKLHTPIIIDTSLCFRGIENCYIKPAEINIKA